MESQTKKQKVTPYEFHQDKLKATIKEFFFSNSASEVIEHQNDLLNSYLTNENLLLTKEQIQQTISFSNEISLFIMRLSERSTTLELILAQELQENLIQLTKHN